MDAALDKQNVSEQLYSYRYVIMVIVALLHLALNFIVLQPGGLAGQLFPALKLQPSQFQSIVMVPFLTGAIFGIPFGTWADKYGVKIVVTIGIALTVVGCFGRVVAADFMTMFLSSFVMGFGLAAINANASKLFGAWFPQRQMGVAMGVYIAAATLGVAIALGTGALFASYKTAFVVATVVMAVILILWIALIRNKPAGAPDLPTQPVMQYLGVVIKNPYIWIAGIAMVIFVGFGATQNGQLANSLVQAKHANPIAAGLVASTVNIAVIVGSIIWPWVAGKIGLMKAVVIPTAFLAAIFSYLGFNILPFGMATYICYFLVGFFIGGGAPLAMAMPMLLPGVGPEYAGSGGGIISMLMNFGSFFLSSYIIVPLAHGNAYTMFLYVAIGYVLFGLVWFLLPELGWRKTAARA